MYVAKSEWDSPDCNQIIAVSNDYEKILNKTMECVKDSIDNGYAKFSEYESLDDMKKHLDENWELGSDNAYYTVEHLYNPQIGGWVCYYICEVEEI